jgi:localization factor PodJL
MTSGVPWQVRGLHPRTLEAVEEAARRAGMSVDEWLDTAILRSARPEGIMAPGPCSHRNEDQRPEPDRLDRDFDDPPRQSARTFSDDERRDPDTDAAFAEVKLRLEALTRQLDQLANASGGQEEARPRPHDKTPRQIATALSRLDRKLDQLSAEHRPVFPDRRPNLDDRPEAALDYEPPRPATAAPAPALAQVLAEIADRQRTFDGESTRARTELPRAPTQDQGGLEQQLRGINNRIDTLRPCAFDDVITTLRDGLAEINMSVKEAAPRRAIEALETEVHALVQRTGDSNPPADQQIAGLDGTVREMSRKLDGIAATVQAPAGLAQIEGAIVGLRGSLTHVASNEALTLLANGVHTLAAKVEQVAGSDALATLERRVADVAEALQSRHQAGQEAYDLEALVRELSDKLDRLQPTHADRVAIGQLEDRIARLIEKLDTSDARIAHLETIEHGLAELPDVNALQHDVQHTRGSIDAMHGTLGRIVERLVTIESGLHNAKAATSSMPMPADAPAPGISTPPSTRRAINPDLPPDHPIEPGLVRSREAGDNTPADRIAASEAALGVARPAASPKPDGKADFIAAARRAARSANGQPLMRGTQQTPGADRDSAQPESPIRIRMLLIGASVALIVLGMLYLLTGLFGSSHEPATVQSELSSEPAASDSAAMPDGADLAPAPTPALTPPPPTPNDRQSSLLPGNKSLSALVASMFLPPDPDRKKQILTAFRKPDRVADRAATGSVEPPGLAAAPATPIPPEPPARPAGADKLPASIGGDGLRAAAGRGDPNAEFEVAVRFAEGRGVPQDLAAAAEWFERAANQGLPLAQFRLGGLYEKGVGVRKDRDRARQFYLAAAQAGHAKAMHNLAALYAEGIEGKPDYQTAARWFRKAADHGVADSQYNLGILHTRGIGVEASPAQAYKWFALAARGGDREAANKRDDIGARLDPATMLGARTAVETWMPAPQPAAAIQVDAPAGGWDAAPDPTAAKRGAGQDAKASRTTP